MRARMAIHYSAIECELREVVLKNKPQAMLLASSKGTVPVVVTADGTVVDESIEVMAWALNKSDTGSWLTHSLDHELIQCNDAEFKFNLDRYKYYDRHPEHDQAWYFEKTLVFLNDLEANLLADSEGNCFLQSLKVTVLDVAIFPFIRQLAFVDKPRFDNQNLPKLQAWLEFFLNSPLFLNVMHKYPAWQAEQPRRILFGT